MPDIMYSTGPIEVEPGVTQLWLKALLDIMQFSE